MAEDTVVVDPPATTTPTDPLAIVMQQLEQARAELAALPEPDDFLGTPRETRELEQTRTDKRRTVSQKEIVIDRYQRTEHALRTLVVEEQRQRDADQLLAAGRTTLYDELLTHPQIGRDRREQTVIELLERSIDAIDGHRGVTYTTVDTLPLPLRRELEKAGVTAWPGSRAEIKQRLQDAEKQRGRAQREFDGARRTLEALAQ